MQDLSLPALIDRGGPTMGQHAMSDFEPPSDELVRLRRENNTLRIEKHRLELAAKAARQQYDDALAALTRANTRLDQLVHELRGAK